MRDDSIEYQERIERLAQYAGRSKRPSVWEDGKEFPWDNKRGKYIRWTQGPNGPVGEEPSFQAVNPLLAFSQNDIIVGEEAQKEKEETKPEPKEEPKEEPKQEPTSAPEEEPKEEKSEEETKESEEKEYDPSLADVFALNEQHKARYDALCESLDDIDKFQMFAFDTFGESFKPDEIKTLRDAREAIENPDILPDFRGRILIEAYHFAREPHSFTLKKTKPDDLREFLTLMDNSRSFYDTLQTFKWTPWAFTLTPKAKYTSHSREEAIKAVYPYKTIPFLSKEQNVDIRSREKKLLELANAPTTSDAEALYILSQLGEVNSAAKSLLDQYKNFPPADGEDEIFEYSKKNLFIELSAVEEKTKILRERASKPSTPKEEPKEEPKEPPKAEPETKEEEPTPEPKPEPVTEPIKEETSAEPLSVDDLCEKLSSEGLSEDEAKKLIETWADSYFDPNETAFYFDAHEAPQKRYVDYFKSDSVPLEVKIEGIREFQKTLRTMALSNDYGYGLADSASSLKELLDNALKGYFNFGHLDKISNTLDKIIKKRRPSKRKKEEPIQAEEETPEPQENREEEEDDSEVEVIEKPARLYDKLLETPDLSVAKTKKMIEAWSQSYFNTDDPNQRKYYEYLNSDTVPVYAKAALVNRLRNVLRGENDLGNHLSLNETIDACRDGRISEFRLETITNALDYVVNHRDTLNANWEDLAKGWKRAYDCGWFSENNNYDLYQRKTNTKKFSTREDAIKNARSLVKLPGYFSDKDKKNVLGNIGYIQKIAAMPTTTDFEAYMLVSALFNANHDMQNATGYVDGDSFKKYLGRYIPQVTLKEIVARDPANAPKPPKEVVPIKEEEEEGKEEPRKPVDLSIHSADSSEDFIAIADKVRDETMTPEEAERNRKQHEILVEGFAEASQFFADHGQELKDMLNEYNQKLLKKKKLEKKRWDWLFWHKGSEQAFPQQGEYDKTVEECYALYNQYVDLSAKATVYRDESDKGAELISKDRKTKMAFLKAAFPDRGGSSFFTPEWKETAIRVLKARDKELASAMEEVIEVYDIIGRCYNTSGATFKPPVMKFGHTGDDAAACYRGDNTITISNKKRKDRTKNDILMYVSHELGHWLELHCLGMETARENTSFLERELGVPSLQNTSYQRVMKRDPNLTVRYDGYGLRVYGKTDFSDRGESEVISTAMEYLVATPVMLAMRSPKQLNLLLRNFEKFTSLESLGRVEK